MRIRETRRADWTHLITVSSLLMGGCGNNSTAATPSTESSSGKSASVEQSVSYADAFPQDRVRRLEITISKENWSRMLADMTELLGSFGSGMDGTSGMGMPMGGGGAAAFEPPGSEQAGAGSMRGPFGAIPSPPFGATAGAPGFPPNGFLPGSSGGATAFVPGSAPASDGMPNDMGQGMTDLIGRTPITVECDITSEDVSLRHVGIRFKGNSSLAMPWQQGNYKLPLRLKFDEFEDTYPETKNQRYFGFKDLSLSNGQSDSSLLRDKIGTELFARAGFAAPATAFYRVYVDHGEGPTYFGLYTGIELPKEDAFLDRFFASHDGNLYKPDGTGARFQTYDAETLGKENNEEEGDYSDVRGLFDALHADRSDAGAWRAGLEARFDVKVFLHWLALNTVAQDWDTYGQMAHNYYLYADPNRDSTLVWIPWDHSYAFSAGRNLSLNLSEVTDTWPLIRYLLDNAQYAQIYRDFVAQAAAEEYAPAWAEARFRAAHALIKPYVIGESGEQSGYGFVTSEASFDASLDELIQHVTQRGRDVAAFLTN